MTGDRPYRRQRFCKYGHDKEAPHGSYFRKNGERQCAVCHRLKYLGRNLDSNLHSVLPLAVRLLRWNRRLSQKQVAKRMGGLRTWVSDVERGKRFPPLRNLLRLSEGLGVPVGDLLRLTEMIQRSGKEQFSCPK